MSSLSSTPSTKTSSESYLNFLEADLQRVREQKNSNRKPFGLLFELVHPDSVVDPISLLSEPTVSLQTELPRKRQKVELLPLRRSIRTAAAHGERSWKMYEESDGNQTTMASVRSIGSSSDSQEDDDEEEKENLDISHRQMRWFAADVSIGIKVADQKAMDVLGNSSSTAAPMTLTG